MANTQFLVAKTNDSWAYQDHGERVLVGTITGVYHGTTKIHGQIKKKGQKAFFDAGKTLAEDLTKQVAQSGYERDSVEIGDYKVVNGKIQDFDYRSRDARKVSHRELVAFNFGVLNAMLGIPNKEEK